MAVCVTQRQAALVSRFATTAVNPYLLPRCVCVLPVLEIDIKALAIARNSIRDAPSGHSDSVRFLYSGFAALDSFNPDGRNKWKCRQCFAVFCTTRTFGEAQKSRSSQLFEAHVREAPTWFAAAQRCRRHHTPLVLRDADLDHTRQHAVIFLQGGERRIPHSWL